MTLEADAAFGSKLPSQEMILRVAGYYWHSVYPDSQGINALAKGLQQEVRQGLRRITEDSQSLDPGTLPVHRVETFFPVDVELEAVREAPIRFGDGYIFGQSLDGQPMYFGQKIPNRWELPIPSEFYGATAIQDRPYRPTISLVEGSGATWRRTPDGSTFLQMEEDPREVFKHIATTTGTRLRVWLYMALRDEQSLYRRFGIVLGKATPSTEGSRTMVKAVWDGYRKGSTDMLLRRFFAGATGNSISEEMETVLHTLEKSRPVVITDKNTYHGPAGSTPVVSEGDELAAGDLIFDVSRFTSFTGGEVPSWLSSLELPSGLFGGRGSVSIPTGEHTLTIGETIDGDKYVQGQGTGDAADLEAFWLGIQQTIPMKDVLATEPSTLDVVSFLAQRWLRYGVSVSRLRTSAIPEELCGMLDLYREITPPWVLHTVQFEGTPPSCWQSPDVCTQ